MKEILISVRLMASVSVSNDVGDIAGIVGRQVNGRTVNIAKIKHR